MRQASDPSVDANFPALVRPPAIPLFTHDPGFSIWVMGDDLPSEMPRHWTGYVRGSSVLLRVDGEVWTLLSPALERRAVTRKLQITPTRTLTQLACGGVEAHLSFCSPLLPDDLDLLSRPLSYLDVEVRATDGKRHFVEVYVDIGAEYALDTVDQTAVWHRLKAKGLDVLRAGAFEQRVLNRAGDNVRPDWGYVVLAVPADGRQHICAAEDHALRSAFIATGTVPEEDDFNQPRVVHGAYPKLAASVTLGSVGAEPQTANFLVGYDEGFCIEYLHRKLRPYWQRDGKHFGHLLREAVDRREEILRRCAAFDRALMADCDQVGGPAYRDLCALAYRQAIAAHKLAVDIDGTPLFFSKENFSNGCIATVDVTYPSAPLFLLINPTLLEAMLTPILQYAASSRWKFPFAPHDLGTYPLANGQVYGGGETSERHQMPVEECGNMLILMGALSTMRGQVTFARRWWPLLTNWADYLVEKGLDPEHQLCTDDFTGHLAHNANLSIKAILGIACAARLADALGDAPAARRYRTQAERMAAEWIHMADDGDHTRLTFDRPGTWSQKYNLVWDRVLELNVFPSHVAQREVAWYLRHQQRYGVPLDSRHTYTKTDWLLWSATLAERQEDFLAMLEPVIRWLNESPSRVPITDWYDTVTGQQMGFQARSVVGGFFIKLLADPTIRQRWRERHGVTPMKTT